MRVCVWSVLYIVCICDQTLYNYYRTQLQVSRQAKPKALDGGPKALKPVEFVKKGKDFSFTDLPSWCSVSFVECSARGKGDEGKAKIKEVQEWIDGLCY